MIFLVLGVALGLGKAILLQLLLPWPVKAVVALAAMTFVCILVANTYLSSEQLNPAVVLERQGIDSRLSQAGFTTHGLKDLFFGNSITVGLGRCKELMVYLRQNRSTGLIEPIYISHAGEDSMKKIPINTPEEAYRFYPNCRP